MSKYFVVILLCVGIASYAYKYNDIMLPQPGECYASDRGLFASVAKITDINKSDPSGSTIIYFDMYELNLVDGGLYVHWGMTPKTTWKQFNSFVFGSEAFYYETSIKVDCMQYDAVEALHRMEKFSLFLYNQAGKPEGTL